MELDDITPAANAAQRAYRPAWADYISDPTSGYVAVLDTGWNRRNGVAAESVSSAFGLDRPFNWLFEPNNPAFQSNRDVKSIDGDPLLDSQAGHGTFIGELVVRIARTAGIVYDRVLDSEGVCTELQLYRSMLGLALFKVIKDLEAIEAGRAPIPCILNLSLCTYLDNDMISTTLQNGLNLMQLLDIVVVAAAGNDGTCRPAFPAAAAGVVGVGAIGRDRIAPFTKWGRWVRACAPGINIVSRFFNGVVLMDTVVSMKFVPFTGWAKWSGTSFAAPAVAAALVNNMMFKGRTPQQAVTSIIDDRRLASIPGLGTIVNAC